MRRLRTLIITFLLLLIAGTVFFGDGTVVFAQSATTSDTFGLEPIAEATVLGGADLRVVIARIINAALGFLGVIAVMIVLYGGYLFLTSNGNEEQVNQAKRLLVNGVIGLVIILSAFSISYFVLRQLSDATETGSVPIPSQCESLRVANDPTYFDLCARGSFSCTDNPAWCCSLSHFVVRSITPLTDATSINDVRPRVILSRATRNPADDVFRIYRDTTSTDITDQFDFVFVDDNRSIIEARYRGQSACAEEGCVPGGNYLLVVNPELRDDRGQTLEEVTSCGEFTADAEFTVNTVSVVDTDNPVGFPGIQIDGASGTSIPVVRGQNHTVSLNVADAAGVSYVRLEAGPGDDQVVFYDGPATSRGSDATLSNPYTFSFPLFIARNTPAPSVHTVTTTLYDIDGRSQVLTTTFVVIGEQCRNGVQDEGETAVDVGGLCPGMGACEVDGECDSGNCGDNGQCVASPLITDISPQDGAPGNMITISGRYFGSAPGSDGAVQFGVDANNDGTYERWVDATLASCGGQDVWNDSWIVVTVPEDTSFTRGPVRVVRGTMSDSSIDDRGPIPGADGLFTRNTTNRPGLCAVTTPTGAVAGQPGEMVIAWGQGFGIVTGRVEFGLQEAPVRAWATDQVNTQVPTNMSPGRVAVTVAAPGGLVSNGVPFTVASVSEEASDPIITAIDPVTTTAGSLVTLIGQYFGTSRGMVFVTDDPSIRCARGVAGCIEAVVDFTACSNSWTDTQVIFQMPNGFTAPDRLYITVQNVPGMRRSAGDTSIGLEAGSPAPGICGLSPASGPAPLGEGRLLSISGINFSNTSRVFFWPGLAGDSSDVSTWLMTDANRITVSGNSLIETPIPVSQVTGLSMQTGPIRVESGNRLSNSMQYTVASCIDLSPDEIPGGYKCCTTGPDQGLLRPDEYICAGETRNAGYVWRFSTGNIPRVPSVIEECLVDGSGTIPSPSPSIQWDREYNRASATCLNAEIAIRFTAPMDARSLIDNTFISTCGRDINEPNCNELRTDQTNRFSFSYQLSGAQSLLTMNLGGQPLESDTWYRVEITEGAQSIEREMVMGQEVVTNFPLRASRPCGTRDDGRETVYCFEFKTASQDGALAQCELESVGMFPNAYTTNYLGIVDEQNPLITTRGPLYYYLWGQSNQLCTIMNIDGQGWRWSTEGPLTPSAGRATVAPGTLFGRRYIDSRATVAALEDTGGDAVRVMATEGNYEAESLLYIDIEPPRVVDVWPDCGAACVNTAIGVQFNRPMNPATFTGNVTLHECLDSVCATYTPTAIPVVDVDITNSRIYRFAPIDPLRPDTSYIVRVSPNILAAVNVGGVADAVEPYSWRFRTQGENGFCTVDSVRVTPDPFTSYFIGEQTEYVAIPHGAPDSCSRFGQELNAWDYGWSWNTTDTQVATVSDISRVAPPRLSCTNACLPRGSTVSVVNGGQVPTLCGDGRVSAGEDCDLGSPIRTSDGSLYTVNGNQVLEQVGVSCTTACIRPGNTLASCGNGQVDLHLGEECDPGGEKGGPAWQYCTNTCLRSGSSGEDRTPGVGWCGDGAVNTELGEDCDINAPGEIIGSTCSSRCLRIGTSRLSAQWCVTHALEPQCRAAVSVCGNGVVEAGENCERVGAGSILVTGSNTPIAVSSALSVCSNRCLLQNICNVTDIPATLRCAANTVGCAADCVPLGSSREYSPPSVCGDGVIGVGEMAQCEYSASEYSPSDRLGQDPQQAVTAVGLGTVDSAEAAQEARIQATAVTQRDSDNQVQSLAVPVTGEGAYALQCGNTEYTVPVVSENDTYVYNNCANNAGNEQGVGANSCCYVRPRRTAEYPVDGSGLSGGAAAVCRNTYIEATFDRSIDAATLVNNIVIVSGESGTGTCPGGPRNDLTEQVNASLATASPATDSASWWYRAYQWVVGLFGGSASASEFRDPAVTRWCDSAVQFHTEVVYTSEGAGNTSTRVGIYINDALLPDHTYAVVLRGGPNGIRDDRGVGILPLNVTSGATNDSWLFRTRSGGLCTVSSVEITPSDYLFNAPNTSASFTAVAETVDGDLVVPIENVYDWEWSWGPLNHPIFAIPAETGAAANASTLTIASKQVEGAISAYANATITTNANNSADVGRIVSGSTELRALFCERPWPDRLTYPYEDGNPPGRGQNDDGLLPVEVGGIQTYFNFSTGYCADAGLSGNTTDDLPYLRPLILDSGNSSAGSLACGPGESSYGGICLPSPVCPSGYETTPINGRCVRITVPTCTTPTEWASRLRGQSYTLRDGQCVPPIRFNPVPVGAVLSGADGIDFERPVDVAIRGNYAYLTSLTSQRVAIFDVSDPTNPTLVNTVRYASGAGVRRVFISGNYLYVLLADIDQLDIYDLTRNPAEPELVSSVRHRVGGVVMDRPYGITVQGNYAYVASLASDALEIIDVTDPRAPRHVAAVTNGQNGALLDGAVDVAVVNGYAYIAASVSNAVQAIDVRNPAAPVVAAAVLSSTDADSPKLEGAQRLAVYGNYLYVAARINSAVTVLDISNPAVPRYVRHLAHGRDSFVHDEILSVHVAGHYLYTSSESSVSFEIIDIQDPANPVYAGHILRNIPNGIYLSEPRDMVIVGDYAYVASFGDNALQVFNIAPPPIVTPSCQSDGTLENGVCTQTPTCPANHTYNSIDNICVPGVQSQAVTLGDLLPSPLKKFLFFNDKNDDVIGVQVFANPERLAARDWYDRYFQGVDAYQPATIGQDAVRNADNAYIHFVNQRLTPDDVSDFIFHISINPGAQEGTRQVYDKLVEALRFNINLTDFGYCSQGNTLNDISRPATDINVACVTDLDCTREQTNLAMDRVCANAITKLNRDLERLGDVKEAVNALELYKNSVRTYPAFSSGSYLPNYTNSRWNVSWRTILDIAPSLSTDPVNNWTECDSSDQATCWNATNATFSCPRVASVYEYDVAPAGDEYTLHVPLEYFVLGSPVVSSIVGDTSMLTADRWCVANQTYSPFRQQCGDGVVNTSIGETCDPPNTSFLQNTGSCAAVATCNSQCQLTVGSCTSNCGNNRIDPGEACDDGPLNDTYNHCSGSGPTACMGPAVLRCGNGVVDQDQGQVLEVCDPGDANIRTTYNTTGFCKKESCRNGDRYMNTTIGTMSSLYELTNIKMLSPGRFFALGSYGETAQAGGLFGDTFTQYSAIFEYVAGTWTNRLSVEARRSIVFNPEPEFQDVAFVDQRGWAVGDNVYYSIDSGATWTRSQMPMEFNYSLGTKTLRSVWFVDQNQGWVVGDLGGIFHTVDGGVTWQSQTSNTAVNLLGVQFIDNQNGIAVGDRGTILRTQDGGTTWTVQTSGTTEVLNAVSLSTSVPYVGWAVGTNGTVLYTSNSGRSWIMVNSSDISGNLRSVVRVDDSNTIIVGSGGRMFTTNNNGTSWVQQTPPSTSDLVAVDVIPNNPGIWVGGGQNIYALSRDTYCDRIDICSTNAECSYDDVCEAIEDTAYNINASFSCASSCQRVGGYCGDGIVQAQYEDCDNAAANGSVNNICTIQCMNRISVGEVSSGVATPACGNGIVEPELSEACDVGGQNGEQCNPAYGQSCNYCSNTCQVLTRDPVNRCGDGVINRTGGTDARPIYEACDYMINADGTVTVVGQSSVTNPTPGTTLSCTDRGAYFCANSCTQLVNNCVSCGLRAPADGGAIPQIALLNPIIGVGPVGGPLHPTSTLGANWTGLSYVGFYYTDAVRLTGGREIPVSIPTDYGYRPLELSDPLYRVSYAAQQHLLTNNGAPVSTTGIESSALCSGEYSVRFDDENAPVLAGDIRRTAGIVSTDFSWDDRIPGDVFPYPVNGETSGVINNELVVSPPVPEGALRIVVRWTNREDSQNALFSGMLYNPEFLGPNQSSVVGYLRAQTETRAGRVRRICYDMEQRTFGFTEIGPGVNVPVSYWWPTGCDPFYGGTVFVHPFRALTRTFTQAMTVYPNSTDPAAPQFGTRTFAFFVDAIGQSMTSFQNSSLQVEVYEYRAGQNPLYSMFLPRVFRIDLANHSDHSGAEYWHVFDLVRSSQGGNFEIYSFGENGHGAVVTDIQAILDNVSGHAGNAYVPPLTIIADTEDGVIFLPNQGRIGGPCFVDRTCLAGASCVNNVCQASLP